MTDDIVAAIDAVIGCQRCGAPLGVSPSDDFCSEGCQVTWHRRRTIDGVVAEHQQEMSLLRLGDLFTSLNGAVSTANMEWRAFASMTTVEPGRAYIERPDGEWVEIGQVTAG